MLSLLTTTVPAKGATGSTTDTGLPAGRSEGSADAAGVFAQALKESSAALDDAAVPQPTSTAVSGAAASQDAAGRPAATAEADPAEPVHFNTRHRRAAIEPLRDIRPESAAPRTAVASSVGITSPSDVDDDRPANEDTLSDPMSMRADTAAAWAASDAHRAPADATLALTPAQNPSVPPVPHFAEAADTALAAAGSRVGPPVNQVGNPDSPSAIATTLPGRSPASSSAPTRPAAPLPTVPGNPGVAAPSMTETPSLLTEGGVSTSDTLSESTSAPVTFNAPTAVSSQEAGPAGSINGTAMTGSNPATRLASPIPLPTPTGVGAAGTPRPPTGPMDAARRVSAAVGRNMTAPAGTASSSNGVPATLMHGDADEAPASDTILSATEASGARPMAGEPRAARAPLGAGNRGSVAIEKTVERNDLKLSDLSASAQPASAQPASTVAASPVASAGLPASRFAEHLQAALPNAHTLAADANGPGVYPAPAQAQLPQVLTSPDFPPALGAQVSLFARNGVERATIEINPPEMGPISVQIALDGGAARIDFMADAAATRQVIESALPTLASTLRDAGLTLTGGGVFQQPQSSAGFTGQGGGAGQPGHGHPGSQPGQARQDSGTSVSPEVVLRTSAQRGLVDLVA